jgi:hypothetical protein
MNKFYMESKNVISFSEFTKENVYKLSPEGNMEKQEWSSYKDVYPEKYDLVDGVKKADSFSWVIKQNDTKIAVLSDKVDQETVNKVVELLSKGSGDKIV